ncbi:Uncharacterised protein [uncultured archaeon]|nr:Uncharacterised protein [uncultured archaeon]
MKKWAKVLVYIGIIWVILILIGLTVLYFNLNHLGKKALISGDEVNPNVRWFLETINLNSVIDSLFRWFIVLAIPSIILFIIASIFGRKKNPN